MLGDFVAHARDQGMLVIQPRMGFGTIQKMRSGLLAVKHANALTAGTITVDSFTRVNAYSSADRALMDSAELNGFPIVSHGARATREMLDGIDDDNFPVQVRHGSALPARLIRTLLEAGITATEGGPVSYCLPYSVIPVEEAVDGWARSVDLCASKRPGKFHLETFGGCMMGQLCPPSMLVAIAILEGIFFREHGMKSISLSYAQQTSFEQDIEALSALRRLAAEQFHDIDWHVVLYTFMGLFPRTRRGAERLLSESVRLALCSGTERLIVKTMAEAENIPSTADNIAALEFAWHCAEQFRNTDPRKLQRSAAGTSEADGTREDTGDSESIYEEALDFIQATLEISDDIDFALVESVRRGYLDIPFCLHPDNAKATRAVIDERGRVRWSARGKTPVSRIYSSRRDGSAGSAQLLEMLEYNRRRFDSYEPDSRLGRPPSAEADCAVGEIDPGELPASAGTGASGSG